MKRSRLAAPLLPLCRFTLARRIITRLLLQLEGGTAFSSSLRAILRTYHQVSVGPYSYGPLLHPGALPPGTTIGSYCSFASGIHVLRRNHPTDRISQHPLFYNHQMGIVGADTIPLPQDNPLSIGHDVWIGMNAIVTPACKSIGTGAIVAAGSVLTRDVPPYAVMGGIPAKLLRARFPEEIQVGLLASKWWCLEASRLATLLPFFTTPLTESMLPKFREALNEIVPDRR